MKLSERAKLLLYFIDEAAEKDWGHGVSKSFFVPKSSMYHYYHNNKSQNTYISGAGDANALKGLERKGLIRRPKTSLPNDYVYETTEDGHALVATFIDEFTYTSHPTL